MINIAPSYVESILDLTCAIQQVPAPTFHEQQRAQFIFQRFQELGLADIQIDTAGNVLARFPGQSGMDARPLIVSAHLDTVHPFDSSLEVNRTRERLTGRAIGDNALGLAALLAIPELFRRQKVGLSRDVWLVANTGEEGLGDLRGMKAVVERFGRQALAYLVIEGMGLGNVLHQGLGVERYRITIQTPGGHSWVDFGQSSAIHELCALVNSLTALPLPSKPKTTLNIGVIQGGNSVNSIAARAWCELDLRSEDARILAQLVDQVHSLINSVGKTNVHPSSERIGKRLAGMISPNHPLVHLSCQVLTDLGLDPTLDIGSTDSNFPLSQGYPSVCLGITHGDNAHAANEYILTQPIAIGLSQLYEVILRLCNDQPQF